MPRPVALASAAIALLCLTATAPALAQQPEPRQPPAQPQQPRQPRPAAVPAVPAPPRYMAAMRAELEAMHLEPLCTPHGPTTAECELVMRGPTTGRELEVHLVYSDETDTIYVYVKDYLRAPAGAPETPALMRRLMELNWELLAAKAEWSSSTGEVRLAIVLHTDSNFDRRAFRSLVRSLGTVADRFYNELSRLAPRQEATQ